MITNTWGSDLEASGANMAAMMNLKPFALLCVSVIRRPSILIMKHPPCRHGDEQSREGGHRGGRRPLSTQSEWVQRDIRTLWVLPWATFPPRQHASRDALWVYVRVDVARVSQERRLDSPSVVTYYSWAGLCQSACFFSESFHSSYL